MRTKIIGIAVITITLACLVLLVTNHVYAEDKILKATHGHIFLYYAPSDWDEGVAFYELLGFEYGGLHTYQGIEVLVYHFPPNMENVFDIYMMKWLEDWQPCPTPAVHHFSLELKGRDSVDDLVETIRMAGYHIVVEPSDTRMQPLEEGWKTEYDIRFAQVRAPGGERIQLYHQKKVN
jgi:hypothetical protein